MTRFTYWRCGLDGATKGGASPSGVYTFGWGDPDPAAGCPPILNARLKKSLLVTFGLPAPFLAGSWTSSPDTNDPFATWIQVVGASGSALTFRVDEG